MNAKNKFREGWIMLLRGFKFHELSSPLQHMTMLYAYSNKPLISFELNDKGKELLEDFKENYGKPMTLTSGCSEFRKRFNEPDDKYEDRMNQEYDRIYSNYQNVEVYNGEIVECYVEGVTCKFYPDEYKVISQETFGEVINGDAFMMKIDNPNLFELEDIKDQVFYIRSRGIDEDKAKHLASSSLKDAIYFKPKKELLEMFTRDHEILEDADYV